MKSLREAWKPYWFLPALGMLLLGATANAQKTTTTTALPTLTGLSVTSVTTPSAAFTLTATGTNFVQAMRRQRGTEIASEEYGRMNATVTSSTQMTVDVPVFSPVKTAIVLHIYVETAGVGRSPESADLTFTINPPTPGPAPTLTSLSETSVNTPTRAFSITATGTNFVSIKATPFHTQVVSVEYGPLPTVVNSATEITVYFPQIRSVSSAVVLHLYVKNPDGAESSTSAALPFTINPPVQGPAPTLTKLSATSVTTPSKDFAFTVTGTNFVSGGRGDQSVVESEEYGPLETTVNSTTQLTVTLPRIRAVTTAIVLHLYVKNPDGTRSASSEDIAFTIEPPSTTSTPAIKGRR